MRLASLNPHHPAMRGAIVMQTSDNHPLDLRDREQTCDAESDAAGFIATVAKNQAVFFPELRVDATDVIAEVEGDYVTIDFPRVSARIKRERFADFMAKEAADSFYLFAKAMFEDLRS